MSQQLGLPRKVGVAAPTEPTDGELPVDAHAPHLVDANSARERFDTGDLVTPPIERLPTHGHIFAEARVKPPTFGDRLAREQLYLVYILSMLHLKGRS
jgi:hypothetical protein